MTDKTLWLAALVAIVSGCSSSSPQFYPNPKLESARASGALDADINRCKDLADQYVSDRKRYSDLARDAALGGAVGAGAGAVAGTIIGGAARGTAAGAAAGAITAILRGAINLTEPSPTYQRFVEICLQKEGYDVIGWN